MNKTRYFHGFGMATREGNEFVMCEGYTGEPYTLPLRVSIPQGDANQVTEEDLKRVNITVPQAKKKGVKVHG